MRKIKINYIFLSLIFLCILLTGNLPAQNKSTPHSLSFGGDVNGNFYFASFSKFNDVENCCTDFGNTFGLGYNIHAGYEYLFPSKLFGMPWKFDLTLGYSDLSAQFSETEKFANIIIGDDYVSGIAEYIIDPNVKSFNINPGIYFDPIKNVPMSVRLGFQVGFLLDMTYYQEERLIEPPDVYYENGERVRGQYSGPIPDAESQYYAVNLGLRYRAAEFGNFALYPSLMFNYGLTNLVQGIDWKASSVLGGISLVYNFPKAAKPRPAAPPLPELPEPALPPVPSTLEIMVRTELNGIDGNEFDLPLTVYQSKSQYYLLPYIFFKENSAEPSEISKHTEGNIREDVAQSHLIEAVADILKQYSDFNVILFASSLDTESEKVVSERITRITNALVSYGIDISRISVSQRKVKSEDFEKPELLGENIFVKLELLDSDLIPYSETKIVKKEYARENILSVIPEINTSDPIEKFKGKIYHDKKLIKTFDRQGTKININTTMPASVVESVNPIVLQIEAFAENKARAKANTKKSLTLRPVEESFVTTVNTVETQKKKYSQFILCYFDFDKEEPKIINYKVLQVIQEAAAEGKKIEILPLTDNIGEENYNNKLATKRAAAALKILKQNNIEAEVHYPMSYLFPNETPLGRMLNRSVVVRIFEK